MFVNDFVNQGHQALSGAASVSNTAAKNAEEQEDPSQVVPREHALEMGGKNSEHLTEPRSPAWYQSAPHDGPTLAELIALQNASGEGHAKSENSLNLSALKLDRLSPHEIKRMHEGLASIYRKPNVPVDTPYAEVRIKGATIAIISNSGGVKSPDAMSGRVLALVKGDIGQGPQLGEQRAEKIAEAFGGKVVKSSTALSQQEWNVRPSVTWTIDTDAMSAHGFDVPEGIQNKQFLSSSHATEVIVSLLERKQA